MEPFRYHVYVCMQEKAEGAPCCTQRGSYQVMDALRREIGGHGLMNEVQVTSTGSQGLCETGPTMVVYPDGVWYTNVQPEDVPEIVRSHFINGVPVQRLVRTDAAEVRAEHIQNRDHFFATLKAKDAAGQLPDDLTARIRAFQESRVILTALELNLFTAVGQGASAADAARHMGTDARATEMLLNALASMDLLQKRNGQFFTTPVTARFFTDSSPDNVRPSMMHTANLWARWSTLTDCVRAGKSVTRRPGEQAPPEWTRAFISAMHYNTRERAPHVIRALGVDGVRRMLDLGGGSGGYAIAFAQANPSLQAVILDLPPVVELAKDYIAKAGVADRVTARPGDMLANNYGQGYDLVLISAICHMFSPQQNRDVFHRAHSALVPGGRLVVQDFILEPSKTAPRMAAVFSLNMLVGTLEGASYSEPEYADWLRAAGFAEVSRVRLPGATGLMIGKK